MTVPRLFLLSGLVWATLKPVAAGAPVPAPTPLPTPLVAAAGTVELEAGARPLSEVLQELSRQVGLALSAGGGLEDQKVTVVFRKLPLADAARALAAATDGIWRERRSRTAVNEEKIEYELRPSERRLAQLTQYREARKMAEKERDQVALRFLLDHLAGRTIGPNRRVPDAPEVFTLLTYPEPLFPIVRSLPTWALHQFIQNAGETTRTGRTSGGGKSPALVIPAASLPFEQQCLLMDFMRRFADEGADAWRAFVDRPQTVQLHFWAIRRNTPDNRTQLEMHLRLAPPGVDWGADLSLGDSPYVPLPPLPDAMQDIIALDARSQHPIEKMRQVQFKEGAARMDRALIEIARAAGINLAADYFTRPEVFGLPGRPQSLERLLMQVEDLYRMVRFWVGPTLVLRSRDWAVACDCEPPVAVTDTWERKGEKLSLDDYVEAARVLDDARMGTLTNHLDERGQRRFQHQVRLLFEYRHLLRGYGALTARQRDQAGGEGLPLFRLTRVQVEQWRPVLQRYVLFSPEQLMRARLLVRPSQSPRTQPMPRFLLAGLPGLLPLSLIQEK